MPYKDKDKLREAQRQWAIKKRQGSTPGSTPGVGITPQGSTESGIIEKGSTTLDTPQDVKAVLTAALGKWHPIDEWTPAEIAAHQAWIRERWCRPGNWNAAYRDLAPKMGWGRR